MLDDLNKSDRTLVDSCLTLYHSSKHDTDKTEVIGFLVEECWSEKLWPKYNAWIITTVSKKLEAKNSAAITINYKKVLAIALNNSGFLYQNRGQVSKALTDYHKSLKISEEIGLNESIAVSLNGIGYIYNHQGDASQALKYYKKALKIREYIGDKEGIEQSLHNIGSIYNNQGESEQALTYFNKSLKIQEELSNKYGMGYSLSSIGSIYERQKNFPKALEYYKKSLKVRENSFDKKGIVTSLAFIGNVLLLQNKFNEALKPAKKSLNLANEIGFPKEIKRASYLLSKIYEKLNNGNKALEMYKLYVTMKDSMNNESTLKATAQQQAKYEYEKQRVVDDAQHDKLLAIEAEKKEKQIILTTATAIGLALVFIFLIFVFNRLRITKKQKVIIEQQKTKVENQKNIVEKAHEDLAEKNKEITDSITYAKRIQSAILPSEKTIKEFLKDSFILYKPKDIVAGDFYWMESFSGNESIEIRDGESTSPTTQNSPLVLFAAADCTGHGVPGAMVSVVCNNALNRSVKEYNLSNPSDILNKTREIVIEEFRAGRQAGEKSNEEVKDGMDIALCSLEGNILKYAGANNPLWIVRNGEILETKANKQPIGQFDNPLPYTTHIFELQEDDTFYVFSDGYVDQFGGEKGKKFKAKAFRKLLLSVQDKTMEEQKALLNQAFETWRGTEEQVDDVCVIGVRI